MQSTHVDTRSSRTHLINRGRVRCQRSATLRAKLWQAPKAFGVAPQSSRSGGTSAMLLRRALPATRQGLAHSFPIYEMGSNKSLQPTALWRCASMSTEVSLHRHWFRVHSCAFMMRARVDVANSPKNPPLSLKPSACQPVSASMLIRVDAWHPYQ